MFAHDLPSHHSSLVGKSGSQPSLVHSPGLWPWEMQNFRTTPLSNSLLELEMYKGPFFDLSCVESYSVVWENVINWDFSKSQFAPFETGLMVLALQRSEDPMGSSG